MKQLFKLINIQGDIINDVLKVTPITFPVVSGSYIVTGDTIQTPYTPTTIDLVVNTYKVSYKSKASNEWYLELSGSSNLTASNNIVYGSKITDDMATVTFDFIDSDRCIGAIKKVSIKPINTHVGYKDALVIEDGIEVITDGLGKVVVSLIPQPYSVTYYGDKKTTFKISPSGVCNASDVIITGDMVAPDITLDNSYTYGYTAASADQRYLIKRNSVTGSSAPVTLQGYFKADIGGVDRWIPFYSSP